MIPKNEPIDCLNYHEGSVAEFSMFRVWPWKLSCHVTQEEDIVRHPGWQALMLHRDGAV